MTDARWQRDKPVPSLGPRGRGRRVAGRIWRPWSGRISTAPSRPSCCRSRNSMFLERQERHCFLCSVSCARIILQILVRACFGRRFCKIQHGTSSEHIFRACASQCPPLRAVYASSLSSDKDSAVFLQCRDRDKAETDQQSEARREKGKRRKSEAERGAEREEQIDR